MPAPRFRRANEVESLFGDEPVVVIELTGEGRTDWLRSDELVYVERAVAKRQREFAAGRACARMALDELGVAPPSLPVGPDREPRWPRAVVGSISHTAECCMAAVGLEERLGVIGLGLDVEVTDRLTPDLYGQILTESERRVIDSLPTVDRPVAASEIFGAKEAFYKAQFPLTRSWVDFTDVRVTRQGDSLRLDPVTALPAFERFDWPLEARVLHRDHLTIVAVSIGGQRPGGARSKTSM